MADRISAERLLELKDRAGPDSEKAALARELLALRTAPEGMESAHDLAHRLDTRPPQPLPVVRAEIEARDAAHNVIAQRLRDRIAEAVGSNTPWPLTDVLNALAAATDHLLDAHSCDEHGYESHRENAARARAYAVAIFAAMAALKKP